MRQERRPRLPVVDPNGRVERRRDTPWRRHTSSTERVGFPSHRAQTASPGEEATFQEPDWAMCTGREGWRAWIAAKDLSDCRKRPTGRRRREGSAKDQFENSSPNKMQGTWGALVGTRTRVTPLKDWRSASKKEGE